MPKLGDFLYMSKQIVPLLNDFVTPQMENKDARVPYAGGIILKRRVYSNNASNVFLSHRAGGSYKRNNQW